MEDANSIREDMMNGFNLTRRQVLGAAAASAAATMLPRAAAAAGPTTLRFGTFVGPTSYLNTAIFEPWFKQIEEASNGSLKIQFLPGGAAAKPNEVVDAVAAGIIDIGWSLSAYNPGRFNAAGVTELPVVTQNAMEGAAGMTALYEADMLDGFQAVKILGIGSADVSRLHDAREISGLSDIQGAKVRAAGRVLSSMLEQIGATPVGMPITSVAESLAKNVIDGAAADWLSLDTFRLIDVTKTHLNLALGAPAMYLVMNKPRYDMLPADAKAAIDAFTPAQFATFWSERIMAESDRVRDLVAEMPDHKVIMEPSAEDLATGDAAAEKVIADWVVATPNGPQILETYTTAVEAFRAAQN